MKDKSHTEYSKVIPGDAGNYKQSVTFDKNGYGGYVGISQTGRPDGKDDRVLLCPKQVSELLKFIGAKKDDRH